MTMSWISNMQLNAPGVSEELRAYVLLLFMETSNQSIHSPRQHFMVTQICTVRSQIRQFIALIRRQLTVRFQQLFS